MGDPVPAYERTVVTRPVLRITGLVLGPAVLVVGTGILIVDEGPFWWPLLAVLLLAVSLGGTLVHTSGVHMRAADGVLEVSAGFRGTRIPVRAVRYAGRARFGGRHARRPSRLNLTGARAGAGIEIVTGNGEYVTARTDTPDDLFRALLAQGLDPNALRAPFPFDAVGYRRVREIHREERTGDPG